MQCYIPPDAAMGEQIKFIIASEDTDIGLALRSYLFETDWNSFSQADMAGVHRFLADFVLYTKALGDEHEGEE